MATDRRIDASLREAMLEDQPDASPVIHRVVARMKLVPWWQRVFAVAPLRIAALASAILVVFVAGRLLYVHQVEKGLALAATYDHYMDLVSTESGPTGHITASPPRSFCRALFPKTLAWCGRLRLLEARSKKYASAILRERSTRISFFKHPEGKSLSSCVPEHQAIVPIRLRTFTTGPTAWRSRASPRLTLSERWSPRGVQRGHLPNRQPRLCRTEMSVIPVGECFLSDELPLGNERQRREL